jgi:protein-tyrosine phosphatase
MDRITDSVWIGDISDAQTESMSDYGITKVITVCQDSVKDNIGCGYSHYNMSDGPDNKYGGRHDYEYFKSATEELLDSLREGNKTLIHCHKGQSRSASVLIAALGEFKSMSYTEAEEYVSSRRPQINPDEILVKHAKNYIKD